MRCFVMFLALFFPSVAASNTAAAQAASELETDRRPGKSFLRAAGGVLAANALVWGVNRYVKDEPWARVGTRSWGRNLGAAFTWDADGFLNNQLGHPYHGGLYFTAARENGYGFWASVPFTAAGSLLWEILGETTAPSLNDLVTTTLGGVALGEITHRLSSQVLRHGGTGRRLAAAVVSPAGGAQRLLGAGESQENLASTGPDTAAFLDRIAIGYLHHAAEGRGSAQAFVGLRAEGASPFDESARRPFDAFELEVEVTTGDPAIVTRARASGLLARRSLRATPRSQLMAGVFQEYDYLNAGSHETGGQSLNGGLLYRRALGAATELRMGAQVRGLLLGAISSDDPMSARRGSDYGPGLGVTVSVSLRSGGRELLRVEHTSTMLWSLSGAEATHRTNFTRVGLRLPITGEFGVGADLELSGRNSRYELSATSHRMSRVKIHVSGP
jgi:hypothetical protein